MTIKAALSTVFAITALAGDIRVPRVRVPARRRLPANILIAQYRLVRRAANKESLFLVSRLTKRGGGEEGREKRKKNRESLAGVEQMSRFVF